MLFLPTNNRVYTLQRYVTSGTQRNGKTEISTELSRVILLLRNPRIPSRRLSTQVKGERRREKEREREERKEKKERGERKKPKGIAEVWFEPVSSRYGHATFHPNVAGYKEIDLARR